MFITNIPIN